jgi:hypothetical protein
MLKKYLFKGAAVVAFITLLVAGKVFYLQRSHFMNAEDFSSKQEWKLAIREYDNAMHFYTPLSPYIRRSAEKLWLIGEMFEKQGRPEWARLAYASIRSSLYASRSFYTPNKDWIRKCDDRIADLNTRLLIREGSAKPGEADTEKLKQLYLLRVSRAPDTLWAVLAEVAFLGWLVSALHIILKGFDGSGKHGMRFGLYGIIFFLATFTLWVVSLLKA